MYELVMLLPMQADIFGYLPDNTAGRLIGIALILLLGWQGKGFIQAFREDRRSGEAAEVDLLEEVKKITANEMRSMHEELVTERRERQKLGRRVAQLERTLISNGIPLPPCE